VSPLEHNAVVLYIYFISFHSFSFYSQHRKWTILVRRDGSWTTTESLFHLPERSRRIITTSTHKLCYLSQRWLVWV